MFLRSHFLKAILLWRLSNIKQSRGSLEMKPHVPTPHSAVPNSRPISSFPSPFYFYCVINFILVAIFSSKCRHLIISPVNTCLTVKNFYRFTAGCKPPSQ